VKKNWSSQGKPKTDLSISGVFNVKYIIFRRHILQITLNNLLYIEDKKGSNLDDKDEEKYRKHRK